MTFWKRAVAFSAALTSTTAAAASPETTAPPPSWVEPGREPAPSQEPTPVEVDPANYRLFVAGNVLTGVGLGAFVVMTAGFLVASDARDRLGFARAKPEPDEANIEKQQRRIRTGNILGISGAAAAGALLVSGLTLIGVGRSRERKRRAALEQQGLVPMFGPGVAGVQWTARF